MQKLNMYQNDTNGKLIVFCGLDGSGKTTMLTRLKNILEDKYSVFLTKQPTDFVRHSEIFRTFMDSDNHNNYDYRSLSLLAASDRVQHSNKVIYPKMKQGDIVISDRYYYSCLANLIARGFDRDSWIYEISSSIVKPDIAFFFDVPVEIAVARVRSRPEEKDRYIDMKLQYELHNLYLSIAEANDGIVISTLQSIEAVEKQMFDAVSRVIEV